MKSYVEGPYTTTVLDDGRGKVLAPSGSVLATVYLQADIADDKKRRQVADGQTRLFGQAAAMLALLDEVRRNTDDTALMLRIESVIDAATFEIKEPETEPAAVAPAAESPKK